VIAVTRDIVIRIAVGEEEFKEYPGIIRLEENIVYVGSENFDVALSIDDLIDFIKSELKGEL
jgi:hypothetical protein